ncbi:hypothetical protein CC1G_15356 [Coprinopsis cinerea okayama7|uniref:Uncharacterized protein n=1 Tax=Coprinopsis cinerea (strain Okayama-7 / 130 / ATCC MYA-4618 / FGSC 9003) TaxID=240176 RepID=D6RQ35_COPC7|nr:hypothetical protein CC1G_15356 [Coprinopsis cinerea okayama7\|eukprot:XP_002910449.1 hypothetical protein CC1G_15356 [Coprinopsis cinerea okayama7\
MTRDRAAHFHPTSSIHPDSIQYKASHRAAWIGVPQLQRQGASHAAENHSPPTNITPAHRRDPQRGNSNEEKRSQFETLRKGKKQGSGFSTRQMMMVLEVRSTSCEVKRGDVKRWVE